MLQGVVVVIERNGKFLFGKRSPHKAAAPGYWCPVSGKIEPGETESEAVVREVREETGLRAEIVRKICEMPTRDRSTQLHWWLVRLLDEGEACLNDEHTEFRWVSLEEMRALAPVFEEDVAVFAELAQALRSENPSRER